MNGEMREREGGGCLEREMRRGESQRLARPALLACTSPRSPGACVRVCKGTRRVYCPSVSLSQPAAAHLYTRLSLSHLRHDHGRPSRTHVLVEAAPQGV